MQDLVAWPDNAAGHLTRVAAVVVQRRVGRLMRPDHVLDRESHVDQVAVRSDMNVL